MQIVHVPQRPIYDSCLECKPPCNRDTQCVTCLPLLEELIAIWWLPEGRGNRTPSMACQVHQLDCNGYIMGEYSRHVEGSATRDAEINTGSNTTSDRTTPGTHNYFYNFWEGYHYESRYGPMYGYQHNYQYGYRYGFHYSSKRAMVRSTDTGR